MNTVCRRHKPAQGFTLVEMMVVMAIAIIITIFAIPSYKSLTTQNRMAGEINDIASDIALARSAAIKQGLTVTICPSANPTATVPTCTNSTEWNTGWISFVDVNNNQTFSSTNGDTLLRIHGPFSGTDTLIASETTGTLDYVTFNRMGGTSTFGTVAGDTNTGTLTLHDSTNRAIWHRCVVLSETGTINVYSEQTQTQGNCP
jgi:type IV fimbrial biogenesis protein FimT